MKYRINLDHGAGRGSTLRRTRTHRHIIVMSPWRLLAAACMATLSPVALSLSSDSKQPMYVESDSVVYDENNGETVYTGAVRARQGSLEVSGDKLIVNQQKGQADQLIVYGNPARLKQTPDGGGPDNHGIGKRADYFPDSGILILNGDAMTWEGPSPETSEHTVKSDHIEYDTHNAIYKAGSSKSGNRRVHVKIIPKEAQPE